MDPAIQASGDDGPEEDFKAIATQRANNQNSPDSQSVRVVNLILDHFAFVRGIGNVKRWFDKGYIDSQLKDRKESRVVLNIYIPTYTLHEFDCSSSST